MKLTTTAILASLMAISTATSFAQGNDQRGPGGPPEGPGGPGGPGGFEGRHHPPPPIIAALDLNHDGIISKEEIAKASESLKTLDKNGDGQLTPDELHPPRPEGKHGPQGPDKPEKDHGQPPPPPPNTGKP